MTRYFSPARYWCLRHLFLSGNKAMTLMLTPPQWRRANISRLSYPYSKLWPIHIMTEYIRRIVSGNKARFKDNDLKLELGKLSEVGWDKGYKYASNWNYWTDLVYVTDRVIIMGYPASGIEGLYRNRREDAKRFLESRHGKNFWVFNFCPLKENAYDPAFFDSRVSRYPFPDHQWIIISFAVSGNYLINYAVHLHSRSCPSLHERCMPGSVVHQNGLLFSTAKVLVLSVPKDYPNWFLFSR